MSFLSSSCRAVILCCLSSIGLWAAKKPLDMDALLAPGHAGKGAAIWAPSGARFIHENDHKVYLYDATRREDKELFSLEPLEKQAVEPPPAGPFGWQNRRVSADRIQWSNDATEILIPAGGDLFLYRFATQKTEQLTATPEAESDPQLSPDGTRVAFRRGHDLYLLDIATRRVTPLTHGGSDTLLNGELDWVYPEELYLGQAFWWSPDGRSIAYMQFDTSNEFVYPQTQLTGLRGLYEPERYPQAGTPNAVVRAGIVPAGGAPDLQTTWLDLGDTKDVILARLDWLRDSRRVGIQRLNRVQSRLDLVVADSTNGAARVILTESDKYWINVSDAYRFLRDSDEFIWSSERDGHRHMYLYSTDGRELARLTSGPWEVLSIAAVDEARKLVYYVSNEGSPLETQLYRVGFDGSGKTLLSRGSGERTINMSPAADYYTETFSNLTTPPAATVHSIDGRQLDVFQEADHSLQDEYKLITPEFVQVKASDGTTLYARLIKPANFKPGRKYPAIVSVYGGPGVQSLYNAWEGANWNQYMAQRGYVIWELDNRGGINRGHAFETPLYRRLGKTELEDQRTGVNYLLSLGFVDPARIGVTGWSYGGYMTLNCMMNAPDLFRAGIAGAPVTNWRNYDTIYTERYLGLPDENADGYRDSSAVNWAKGLKGRLLIVHDIEDDNVLFQNTVQICDALESAGKLFSLVPYMEKTHGLTGPVRRHLYETMTTFFDEALK